MREQKRPSRWFLRGIRIAVALLLIWPVLLAGAATPVLALDPVQTVSMDGGHVVSFYGVYYDVEAGASTYLYSVRSGTAPSLSHINMELKCPPPNEFPFVILDAGTWVHPSMAALNAGEGAPEMALPGLPTLNSGGGSPVPSEFPAVPTQDPTTGATGIKFDQELAAGETLYFYFTLEGGFPPGALRIVVKAGQTLPEAYILGPGCVVPGAVTVSSFEVLRDNDTLRFKWTTETEIDNLGFDLFAVEPDSNNWLRMNNGRIAPQGLGIEPQDYYYQVERPGLATGAGFYLRAYDQDGTYESFGPVQAIYSASVPVPIAPVPPPAPPPAPRDRPIVEPRTDPVLLPDPIERDTPVIVPVLPIREPLPPMPGPIAPRTPGNLRPGPIVGTRL